MDSVRNYIVYKEFAEQLLLGHISFKQPWHRLKVILTLDYQYSEEHVYYSDVEAWEVTGEGYTKGGKDLEFSGTVKVDNTITVNANNNTAWENSTISANGAIVITRQQGEGTEDAQILVGYYPMGTTKSSENGKFAITWSNHGLLTLRMN